MDFVVINKEEGFVEIEWFPSLIDFVFFGRRNHVAKYRINSSGGWVMSEVNKPVKHTWTPPDHFFESIKSEQL